MSFHKSHAKNKALATLSYLIVATLIITLFTPRFVIAQTDNTQPVGDVPVTNMTTNHIKDPVTGKDLILRTHVDAGHVFWNRETQQLEMGVIDGKTLRPANEVAIRVGPDAYRGKDASRIVVPDDPVFSVLGEPGTILWNSPRENRWTFNPVWAGLGAGKSFPANIDPSSLTLELVDVKGPGWLAIWWHKYSNNTMNLDFDSRPGGKRTKPIAIGDHWHLNWSFSKQGRYTVTWKTTARTTTGETIESEPIDILWLVGEDQYVGLPEGTTPRDIPTEELVGIDNTAPEPVNEEDPVAPETPNNPSVPSTPAEPESPAEPVSPTTPVTPALPETPITEQPTPILPTENNPLRLETAPTATAPEAGSYVIAKPGHFDLAFSAATKTRSSTNLNAALIDSSEPGKDIARASHTVVIPVPDSTISELQTTGNHAALAALGAAGTKVWSLPDVQNPDLVWLGWNTEQMPSERLGKNSRIGITKHYGPGEVAQWTAGGIYPDEMLLTTTDPGRTLNMPVATHMHMVTTFTQPGLHEVEHSFVDELGEQVSYTTYFAVGDKTIAELQKAAKNAGEITTGKTGVEGEAEEKENSAAQSPENNAAENTGAGTEVAETQCIPTTIRREATVEEARDLQNSNSANSQNIATTTLNFNVGSGGGISSGHFDLGPGIENGKVTAKLKDDRSQPAQWIDPASVSFALGEASAITAPELLNFVATPGSKVWMISSVQQQNVPWIGMNSQRPEIVNGTTGTVKFTLKSVAGPGKIAVFESGALGSGIGRKLFTSPGSSFTLPKNTHAHYNWVFTQPGTYRVTIAIEVEQTSTAAAVSSAEAKTDVELGPNGRPMISVVVGKTATGEDCELALTGNSNISTLITLLITLFSVGVVLSVTPRFKNYLNTFRS